MATHGGTISWKARKLARIIVSGPIGGVIGGASFDVALITQGELTIRNNPDMARLVPSLPLVAID